MFLLTDSRCFCILRIPFDTVPVLNYVLYQEVGTASYEEGEIEPEQ
jgi:hypothetical protein